jgi:hypothetical protein
LAAASASVRRMTMVVVAVALTLVGVALASNFLDVASRGAGFNAAVRGLHVNSQPRTWRFTGGLFIAIGVPLMLWAELQLANVYVVAGRLALAAVGILILHDVLSWDHSWLYNGRLLGSWIRRQSVTAQTLWRMSMGIIAGLALLGAVFGTAVTR